MKRESMCSELLQAAGRCRHHYTDIEDDVYGLGVTTESAATAMHTLADSCNSTDTDKSEWP